MQVVKVIDPEPGEPGVVLVDEEGVEVVDVSGFLRTLTVRRYSPNTVRAYPYDLRRLLLFLDGRGLSIGEFTPARAVDFLATLRRTPSARRAQRLDLAATADGGRLLSPRACNRILGAVSSFYEYLITMERYGGPDNPITKGPDHAAVRGSNRWKPPLLTSGSQRPVRRTLRARPPSRCRGRSVTRPTGR